MLLSSHKVVKSPETEEHYCKLDTLDRLVVNASRMKMGVTAWVESHWAPFLYYGERAFHHPLLSIVLIFLTFLIGPFLFFHAPPHPILIKFLGVDTLTANTLLDF